MDTSKEYIEMCDCSEIQGQKPILLSVDGLKCYDLGSYYAYEAMKGWVTMVTDGTLMGIEKRVWLPRQDQLQEMVEGEPYETMMYGNIKINETKDFISLLPNILLFAYDWDYGGDNITLTYKQPFQSMEQLWLAFYMHEKHGKAWIDGKWELQSI